MMQTGNARERILEAANRLVQESGPASLTLDAAAREAGVSKGGLLYHFASKDALIEGMLEAALSRFEADVDAAVAENVVGRGEWLKAFVRVTFEARPEHNPANSILAAAATNPTLLGRVSDYFERWQQRAVSDGCKPTTATVVRLASDGLWFADMFTTTSPTGEERSRVLDELLGAIDDNVSDGQRG